MNPKTIRNGAKIAALTPKKKFERTIIVVLVYVQTEARIERCFQEHYHYETEGRSLFFVTPIEENNQRVRTRTKHFWRENKGQEKVLALNCDSIN